MERARPRLRNRARGRDDRAVGRALGRAGDIRETSAQETRLGFDDLTESRIRWYKPLVHEVDFLAVGQAGRHGDAITVRFTRPDTGAYAHVVIDTGFRTNGMDVVRHVERRYGTSSIDLAIVTHPDEDHISGMGDVLRGLNVATLCIHRLDLRGGAELPAAEAVADLVDIADAEGTSVTEPFAGGHAFGSALRVLGPTEDWYAELVAEQVSEHRAGTAGARAGRIAAAARRFGRQFLDALPAELPFGDAGGTNPRNNSSAITMLEVEDKRMLFTADAGVPALDRAWDWVELNLGDPRPPNFVQIPHHGSRRNASSAVLNRILGRIGPTRRGTSYVNVAPEAVKHPAARVANAFMRRGYAVCETKGQNIWWYSGDAPDRPDYVPLVPLAPMDESEED